MRAMTGIRPTGELTVGNYAGAIKPLVELQETYPGDVLAFVADYHGLTTEPPSVIKAARLNTIRSYMAGGVDPAQVDLYTQSHVIGPTFDVEFMLSTLISEARATRVPTLKEKLARTGDEDDTSRATMALIRYPLLMAADIVVQDADHVPVGRDQYSHLELTRDAVAAFNRTYGAGTLTMPDAYEDTGVKINSLTGGSKMSKSDDDPNGAIMLGDNPDDAVRKIRRAVTGEAGAENPQLENYMLLCERLGGTPDQLEELRRLYAAHQAGSAVMKQFKGVMADVVVPFLREYQERYASISDEEVEAVLRRGNAVALRRANAVARRVRRAMDFV